MRPRLTACGAFALVLLSCHGSSSSNNDAGATPDGSTLDDASPSCGSSACSATGPGNGCTGGQWCECNAVGTHGPCGDYVDCTCGPPPPPVIGVEAGAPCNPDFLVGAVQCVGDFACDCSTRLCAPLKALGEGCFEVIDCQSGLVCVDATQEIIDVTCAPDAAAPAPGTCAEP